MQRIKTFQTLPSDCYYDTMDSPVGLLTLIGSSQGLHAALWDSDLHEADFLSHLQKKEDAPLLVQTKTQLSEYFEQKRTAFDLPLVMEGTSFQTKVWSQLIQIPYGTTLSYGQLAGKMGDKNKARAVGSANGNNPICIIIPCHRVIGSGGKLGGFGGGLDKKTTLLQLERSFILQF